MSQCDARALSLWSHPLYIDCMFHTEGGTKMEAHLIKALRTALATSRTLSLKNGHLLFAALQCQSYFDSRLEEQSPRPNLILLNHSMWSVTGSV